MKNYRYSEDEIRKVFADLEVNSDFVEILLDALRLRREWRRLSRVTGRRADAYCSTICRANNMLVAPQSEVVTLSANDLL